MVDGDYKISVLYERFISEKLNNTCYMNEPGLLASKSARNTVCRYNIAKFNETWLLW